MWCEEYFNKGKETLDQYITDLLPLTDHKKIVIS